MTLAGNITAATGTITAEHFYGDGSQITGIVISGSVLKIGDTMSGPLESTVATGTAPIVVNSTTVATRLNADLLDGQHGAYYLNAGSAYGGDISGTYNNLEIGTGAVGSSEVADNSLAASDLSVNVVSSVAGVTNDGGDIALVAGSGITITPDDPGNQIIIAANLGSVDHGGLTGLGDDDHPQYVKDSGDTLTGPINSQAVIPTTTNTYGLGDATHIWSSLNIAAGGYSDGSVTSADLQDGAALAEIANNDGTGSGLDADLLDGQQGTYYLNTGTPLSGDVTGAYNSTNIATSAIGSAEILDNSVATGDVAFEFVGSLGGVKNKGGDIALVAGSGVTITPDDALNKITIAANAGTIDHGGLTGLVDDDHPQYVKDSGDTMAGTLTSSVATGTAPIVVDSTTVATRLNADLLDGQHGTYYLNVGTSHGGDVSGTYNNIQIGAGVVGSAEVSDGSLTASDLAVDVISSINSISNDGGNFDIIAGSNITLTPTATSSIIISAAVSGSAVDHNTLANLTIGDAHPQYFNLSQNETVTGIPAFNGGTTGTTAPFTVDSTFLVTNLNADLLDGSHAAAFMTAATDNWVNATGDTITGTLTSTVATGTAPIVVDSTTVATRLNADLLDGQHGTYYLNAGTAYSGDVSGAYNNLQIGSGAVGSSEVTDNSLSATDLSVNVISSLDGVTNDGGDIDFVAGAGITITPDDPGNQITITANFGSIDHGSISGLGDDDHTQYFALAQNETVTGIPAFNGGTTGTTAPFTVDSTFLVTNLNADLLDGQQASAFISSTGATMTGAITMSGVNGDINFDNAGGLLTMAGGNISDSVGNLNLNDNTSVSGTLGVTGAVTGSNTITGTRLISNIAIGTAPLSVISTTNVTNLNADFLDGYHAASFILDGCTDCLNAAEIEDIYVLNTSDTTSGSLSIGTTLGVTGAITGSSTVQGTQLISTIVTGTAPLTVISTTVNTNLNADMLDGNHAAAFMTAATDNWVNAAGDTMTGILTMSSAAADITFNNAGGNLTMAGGNISDSVGNLNINDSISVSGSITAATGTITAQQFSGNGSALSGLKSSRTIVITGEGLPIATGAKDYYVRWPYAATLNKVSVLSNTLTTTTVDIWKDAYANFPPTNADSIFTPGSEAKLIASRSSETTSFFNSAIAAGDVLAINIDTNDNATVLTIILESTK
ncbi:MAG: hypothetical protein WCX65_07575 [bacterium]